ncbi:MAG: NAD(P)-dependent oxidoreductase [Candidatus Latescibacterota bacterium]
MSEPRPKVLLAFDQRVRDLYATAADLERLQAFADWEWFACTGGAGRVYGANQDPELTAGLAERLAGCAGLVVCHGCPVVTAQVLDQAPGLRIIGELEGDRFAGRIELEAAWQRGIRTVDTTNGSSYPVAEWALALILISLRNAGHHFRRIIAGQYQHPPHDDPGFGRGELWGKRVGLVGCGHVGRRLLGFLRPFHTEVWVYDPYLPREMADALGFLQTSLDNLMAHCDAVVCLAPHTPRTERLIGARELDLLRPGAVLVNVSRGKVIDTPALVARLRRGDIVAGLDVLDPEPYSDHEIIHLDNVFLSPHIAGVTAQCGPRFFALMVDELDRFFHGHETQFDLTPRSRANRRGEEPG